MIPDPKGVVFQAPGESILAFKKSLNQQRESAWQIAHYERAQRDDYTSKIRFGLVTVNAASLVTVLNVGERLVSAHPDVALVSAAFYFAGVLFSGYSLMSQQNHLILQAGNTSARAIGLDTACALAEGASAPGNLERAQDAAESAHELGLKSFELSAWSSTLQHLGIGAWIAGSLTLAFTAALPYLPAGLW